MVGGTPDLTLTHAHDLAHHAEAHLLDQVRRLTAATVHTSPAGTHTEHTEDPELSAGAVLEHFRRPCRGCSLTLRTRRPVCRGRFRGTRRAAHWAGAGHCRAQGLRGWAGWRRRGVGE